MRSVGRCLLFATTPLAVLLLTAAAAPADPPVQSHNSQANAKDRGTVAGSGFTAHRHAACSSRPNDGMAICTSRGDRRQRRV